MGDFQQLEPIAGASKLRDFCAWIKSINLLYHEASRSNDKKLLDFLGHIRTSQPTRQYLAEFFRDRYLGTHLSAAVAHCIKVTAPGIPMTWLTCTNRGAMTVNYEFIRQLGYGTIAEIEECEDSFPGDPDYGKVHMKIRPGMLLRLTRNLDKERGFCNGALGVVKSILALGYNGPMFTVELTHGTMILVHPIRDRGACFLPCIYGYAMTTRKAQGATLGHACVYFDLHMPASRGFTYVGASRVRRASTLFYFGKVRRSDWLPIGGPGAPVEQDYRSAISEDSAEDERGDDTSEEEYPDLMSEAESSIHDQEDTPVAQVDLCEHDQLCEEFEPVLRQEQEADSSVCSDISMQPDPSDRSEHDRSSTDYGGEELRGDGGDDVSGCLSLLLNAS